MTVTVPDAVDQLWDRLLGLADGIGPDDWSRPTPAHGLDLRGLVGHLAGPEVRRAVDPAAAPDPLAGLRAARRARQDELDGLLRAAGTGAATDDPRTSRRVDARCLDLWVHAHDLGSTLGTPTDLDDSTFAVHRSSTYLLRLLPTLAAPRLGTEVDRREVRVRVRGLDAPEAVAAVRRGRGVWLPGDHRTGDEVSATPAALVLLLSGRVAPDVLRRHGALRWSGSVAEDLVRHARIPW